MKHYITINNESIALKLSVMNYWGLKPALRDPTLALNFHRDKTFNYSVYDYDHRQCRYKSWTNHM